MVVGADVEGLRGRVLSRRLCSCELPSPLAPHILAIGPLPLPFPPLRLSFRFPSLSRDTLATPLQRAFVRLRVASCLHLGLIRREIVACTDVGNPVLASSAVVAERDVHC